MTYSDDKAEEARKAMAAFGLSEDTSAADELKDLVRQATEPVQQPPFTVSRYGTVEATIAARDKWLEANKPKPDKLWAFPADATVGPTPDAERDALRAEVARLDAQNSAVVTTLDAEIKRLNAQIEYARPLLQDMADAEWGQRPENKDRARAWLDANQEEKSE